MEPTTGTGFQVVDKRRTQDAAGAGARRDIPAGQRAHSVLLGYYGEEEAQRYLETKGIASDLQEEVLRERERAVARMRTLSPLNNGTAALAIDNVAALKEIDRVMSRPECKAAYPQGSWTAELVEISKIIPYQPGLDIDYAESLGNASLDPRNLMSAVQLCFAEKHPAEVNAEVDQSQKAITVSGINPSLEVVGLRYVRQEDNGPLIISFMVSPSPNIVCVTRFAGRRLLSSGYHRVYRLMKAGFTHAPCIVREAEAFEQTGAYGPGLFREAVLMAPRPPLFPDYADPVLGIVVPLPALEKVVRIRPDEYFVLR